MFCKWCGMESDTEEICSWCGAALTPAGVAQVEKQKQASMEIAETETVEEGKTPAISSQDITDQSESGLVSRAARPLVSPDDTSSSEEVQSTSTVNVEEYQRPIPRSLSGDADSGAKTPPKKVLPGMPPPPRRSGVVPPPIIVPKPVTPTFSASAPVEPKEPLVREAPLVSKMETVDQPKPEILYKPSPLNKEIEKTGEPASVEPKAETAQPVETETTGKTWYCRWCGMESVSPDICSWCHKNLTALPEITPREKPESAPASAETKSSAPSAPTQPSKESNSRAFILQEETVLYRKYLLTRSIQYLGCLVVIVILSLLVLRQLPSTYLFVMGAANFASCILMPLIGVAPFGEDDSEDIALGLGLFLIMGPLAGGIIYSVIGMIKQSVNPAIIGVLLTYLIIRLNLDVFLHRSLEFMLPWQGGIAEYAPQALVLAGIAGWYAAGVFHKHDE